MEAVTLDMLRMQLDARLEGKGNVLMLADDAVHGGYLRHVRDQLPRLRAERALGTLGIECPAFMNVFFWAYSDGKMQHALGEEGARNYLRQMFTELNTAQPDYAKELADTVITALDAKIRVVAFGGERTFDQCVDAICSDTVEALRWQLSKRGGEQYAQYLRTHGNGALSNMMDEAASQASHSLQYWDDKRQAERDLRRLRVYKEAEHWLSLDRPIVPEDPGKGFDQRSPYEKRMGKIDLIIRDCQSKNIRVDATDALLFSAMALPGENSITIGHVRRLDGMGRNKEGHASSLGALGEYMHTSLNHCGTARVSKLGIADAALLKGLRAWQDGNAEHYRGKLHETVELEILNLEGGGVEFPALLQQFKPVTLEEKLHGGGFLRGCKKVINGENYRAQLNPLGIKQLEDRVVSLADAMGKAQSLGPMKQGRLDADDYTRMVREHPLKPERAVNRLENPIYHGPLCEGKRIEQGVIRPERVRATSDSDVVARLS